MRRLIASLPLIRRPFYQRDMARLERDAAIAERDAANRKYDALKAELYGLRHANSADAEAPDEATVGSSLGKDMRSRICSLCNNEVAAWRPFEQRPSEFLMRLEPIGSNIDRFWCPHCSSIDRERHLALFFDRLQLMQGMAGGTVLHIAPEFRLREYVLRFGLATYVQGDLSPQHESIQRIDVQNIPFPDKTFDMIICNHVLEHVEDAQIAMRELHRVLKVRGRAICQTPYASRLSKTFEEPLLQTSEDRVYFYGQDDHVRLFGLDIEQKLQDAGFAGRLVPHTEILPDVDPEFAGINEKEPFFDFVRR
jgi:SAM-dependent methyltransferase